MVSPGFEFIKLSKSNYLIDGKEVLVLDETSEALPRVSVTMITYNHENFIKQAIEGVLLQQTNFKFVLIIGEDFSTDGTRNIVLDYQRRYKDKIILKLPQKNLGINVNSISNNLFCSGKYIAICEGDDYWTDPLKLQKQVDFLENNVEYIITYTRALAFDESGFVDKKFGAERDLSSEELIKCNGINTLTTCFRNVIEKYPKEMNTSQFGDLFLWSLLGHFGKGKFLEEIKPSMYRIHSSGAFSMQTLIKKKEMWFSTSHALYTYYNRIGNDKYKKYFEEMFLRSVISHIGYKTFLKIFFRRLFQKIKFF
jgi:glycosyltransferase involved in cell wall biosynthesis